MTRLFRRLVRQMANGRTNGVAIVKAIGMGIVVTIGEGSEWRLLWQMV